MHTLHSYTLAQMEKGLTEQFTVTITEEKMAAFCALSGDISPIHLSESYAAGRGYPGRVCYGMLVASFFSTLAGVYLPGEHCLLHSVETKFAKPVFIGDTLTITGVVEEVNAVFGEVTIKAQAVNQAGKKVCRATIKAGLAK
ncbi:MAG: MaoC family dehydratase [Pygmaiobacter massiliensis]|nr:MaoC family dehydratase [Pygmaiobacter massiliensis]